MDTQPLSQVWRCGGSEEEVGGCRLKMHRHLFFPCNVRNFSLLNAFLILMQKQVSLNFYIKPTKIKLHKGVICAFQLSKSCIFISDLDKLFHLNHFGFFLKNFPGNYFFLNIIHFLLKEGSVHFAYILAVCSNVYLFRPLVKGHE